MFAQGKEEKYNCGRKHNSLEVTIINLFSLEDDKEHFHKYVLPILDAIKHRNPDILIEEPNELAK